MIMLKISLFHASRILCFTLLQSIFEFLLESKCNILKPVDTKFNILKPVEFKFNILKLINSKFNILKPFMFHVLSM